MSLKRKIVINTFWSIGGLVSNSLIQLVANVIFARFLSPLEFGQIGIVMFFVLISNVLIEGGLGGALVRKNNSTEEDFSTVFVFNFFVSLILYLVLILCAQSIANYYHDSELKNLLIITGSVLVINSFTFIQNNRLVKDLQFKKITKYRLLSVIFANSIGIILLFFGIGIWAIVATIILTPLFLTFVLWWYEGFVEKIVFRMQSFRSLYRFGVNTSLATIIDTIFNNIYQLVLGRYFSILQVGYYYQAKKLQDVPNNIVFGTTNSVIFSGLAKLQDNQATFSHVYNRIISYFSILVGIITLTIMTFSDQIVVVLYGKKWESSGFFLFVLSIASFFYVHEMFNRVVFKVFDKTNIILRLELIKKVVLSLSIVIGVILLNINVLLYGFLIVSIISYILNYFISRKIMHIHGWNELLSVIRVFVAVSIGFVVIMSIKNYFNFSSMYSFAIIFFIIVVLYFLLLWIQGVKIRVIDIKELLNFK